MNAQQFAALITDRLIEEKERLSAEFRSNSNETITRFFVLDDLLPASEVIEAYNSFPSDKDWLEKKSFREWKLVFTSLSFQEHGLLNELIDAFQDQRVIGHLEDITGISGLCADPTLYAGGISRMDKDHFLNPHIDNSHNSSRSLYRRLNILFYTTPDLSESDGGTFELWNAKINRAVNIPAKFNRLVVMETNNMSWHSVSKVASEVKRTCVSNYYFSEASPTGKEYFHVTSFMGRPDQRFLRLYSHCDNFLRQNVAEAFSIGRGKRRVRS